MELTGKEKRKKVLKKARRIVVKVGSSILASVERGLHYETFSHLSREISELKRHGYEIVLVSSGAIAAGMEKLGYKTRPQSITQKQATAAVGQSRLIHIYENYFSRYQQMVAQILLTHDDLSHRRRFLNAKVQRPGVCNARVVKGIEEAIEHIATYGSLHTEAILTSDYGNAQRFLREVNASCVLINGSTRFNDGFELGLGAEMGISTSKLHAFGPMGLWRN